MRSFEAAFHVAYPTLAEVGALGKLSLGQPQGTTLASKQLGEGG